MPYYADLSFVPGPLGSQWSGDLDGRDRAIAGLQKAGAAVGTESV